MHPAATVVTAAAAAGFARALRSRANLVRVAVMATVAEAVPVQKRPPPKVG